MNELDPNHVRIFDTTLRDGEQSPGATLTSDEKLGLAWALARLGVDVIEAGFPAASPDDLHAVQRIAATVGGPDGQGSNGATPPKRPPIICGLARAAPGDIDKAWEAVREACSPRIHTFLATSDIHMQHKLRMTREQVVSRMTEMVTYARSLCEDVEFSPEDAGRSDPGFLREVVAAAIAAGATTVNIPDTVGYTIPGEFQQLIAGIMANTPGIEQAVVSVHCHNDLGLATANSLAGVEAGARQVEVTINGIGERAGNTSLEEVVMAIHSRRSLLRVHTGIDTTQIVRTSRMVSSATGIPVQPNKAIVGANAFAHEAGIHQDGMLKHQETYEIMRPETVGAGQSRLVLGKHSGRHALRVRLKDLGYDLSQEDLDKTFARYKLLADKKKNIDDRDLEVVVADELGKPTEIYTLEGLQVTCGTTALPTATIRLKGPDGTEQLAAAVGAGPIQAIYAAIDDVTCAGVTLLEYAVHAASEGIDALGEVTVRLQAEDTTQSLNPQHETGKPRAYIGHGASTDVVVASAKAYLAAVNKILVARLGTSASAEPPVGKERPAVAAGASP